MRQALPAITGMPLTALDRCALLQDPTGEAATEVQKHLTFYELDLGVNNVVREREQAEGRAWAFWVEGCRFGGERRAGSAVWLWVEGCRVGGGKRAGSAAWLWVEGCRSGGVRRGFGWRGAWVVPSLHLDCRALPCATPCAAPRLRSVTHPFSCRALRCIPKR